MMLMDSQSETIYVPRYGARMRYDANGGFVTGYAPVPAVMNPTKKRTGPGFLGENLGGARGSCSGSFNQPGDSNLRAAGTADGVIYKGRTKPRMVKWQGEGKTKKPTEAATKPAKAEMQLQEAAPKSTHKENIFKQENFRKEDTLGGTKAG